MQIAAKQHAVDLNAPKATVAVVSQANRVQLKLRNMNVRSGEDVMKRDGRNGNGGFIVSCKGSNIIVQISNRMAITLCGVGGVLVLVTFTIFAWLNHRNLEQAISKKHPQRSHC